MPTGPAVLAGSLLALAFSAQAFAGCPPTGWDTTALATLKTAKFDLPDNAKRQVLAVDLLDCLESPNPVLRDGTGFEALSTWMRAGALTPATLATIRDRLEARLDPARADVAGFGQPFAALVLSEVARTDLVAAWMTPADRKRLVDVASIYMESITDYRGFDDREGWRHGVAHDADLLMQLARNPALEKPQLDRMLAAIASQVAPKAGPAYSHGEPERLVRPVMFIAARGLISDAERDAWFARLADPAPAASWPASYSSSVGLARRHDVRAFLLALNYAGFESKDPGRKAMADAALASLRAFD